MKSRKTAVGVAPFGTLLEGLGVGAMFLSNLTPFALAPMLKVEDYTTVSIATCPATQKALTSMRV